MSADKTPLVVHSNGAVGIGTASPAQLLTIQGDNASCGVADAQGQLAIRGSTDPNKRLVLGYHTDSNYGWIQPGRNGQPPGYDDLKLCPAGGNLKVGDKLVASASGCLYA